MYKYAVVVAVLVGFATSAYALGSKYYITRGSEGCQVNEWSQEEVETNPQAKIVGNGFENKKEADDAMAAMKDCLTSN
jgi:hypothetical protein